MNKIPMRDGYGKALLKFIGNGKPVVALDADVAKSTRTVWVRDQYPEHFLDMGIAEQDMVGTASGLALGGIIPFASTYGVFLAGRGHTPGPGGCCPHAGAAQYDGGSSL